MDKLYEANIQAEFVGQHLQFITNELTRLREERRVAAMIKVAERERRMKEAEESGNHSIHFLFYTQHFVEAEE